MGGFFDTSNPADPKCDIRRQVCLGLNIGIDLATGRCDQNQMRQAMLMPVFGSKGVCNTGEYLRGITQDGQMICGRLGAGQTVPIDWGPLDPVTECGPCYAPSLVKCTSCNLDGSSCIDSARYMIFSGGQMQSSVCGTPPVGLSPCVDPFSQTGKKKNKHCASSP
jgi:hypothetical protein